MGIGSIIESRRRSPWKLQSQTKVHPITVPYHHRRDVSNHLQLDSLSKNLFRLPPTGTSNLLITVPLYMFLILYCQYYSCWCPGDLRRAIFTSTKRRRLCFNPCWFVCHEGYPVFYIWAVLARLFHVLQRKHGWGLPPRSISFSITSFVSDLLVWVRYTCINCNCTNYLVIVIVIIHLLLYYFIQTNSLYQHDTMCIYENDLLSKRTHTF